MHKGHCVTFILENMQVIMMILGKLQMLYTYAKQNK